ncbi:MAG: diadenylate cyclase [Clostridia bacterium]|nr:diadenylate cyclase [Clostridia bacterium]
MNLADKLAKFWGNFISTPEMTIAISVTVVVFAVLYFYMLNFLFKQNAHALVALFTAVMVVSAAIVSFVDTMDSAIFLVVPAIFIVLIMIIYSVEIRRVVWARRSLKKNIDSKNESLSHDTEKIKNCVDEIIKALQNMSKNDVGAILILSTGNVPTQIIDSGVKLDSEISSELIESVFFPKSPLHDGAMIIDGTKIVAAGCFLPLSQNVDSIPKELGTRHRAGIGVTETIDVVSFIVSEETGVISVATAGKIKRYADTETLRKALNRYYWQDIDNARR